MADWAQHISQFNHGWLQNGVIVALHHALGVASGSVRSTTVRRTLEEDVARWAERGAELPGLLDAFESEMSPRNYFDRAPLCRCAPSTIQWLAPLVHEAWLKREDVHRKLSEARALHARAQETFRAVSQAVNALPDPPGQGDLARLQPLLKAHCQACEALSRAVSGLPREIRCV